MHSVVSPFIRAAVLGLLMSACHESVTGPALLACRIASTVTTASYTDPAGVKHGAAIITVGMCYSVCPAEAESFALAHNQSFTRLASCGVSA